MDPSTQSHDPAAAADGYSDDGFEPAAESSSSLIDQGTRAGCQPSSNGNVNTDGYSEEGFESAHSDESLNRDSQRPQDDNSHTSQPALTLLASLGKHKGNGPLPPVSNPSGRGRNKGKSQYNRHHTNTQPNHPRKLPQRAAANGRRSPSPAYTSSPHNAAAPERAGKTSGSTRPTTATVSSSSSGGGGGTGALKRLMSIENFPTIQPVANRLLAERWEKKRFNLHQKALREVQATVDDSCPGSFGEWRTVNPKKVQIEKDRQSLIDHRNTQLLGKFQQVADATHREYAVNPRATQLRDTLLDRVHTRRVKQLHTIDAQNETLLRRIDGKSSMYRVSSWTVERLQTLYYLINVSDHKSKYVQEMVRLSESLLAAGQVLPPNIRAVVEPLIGTNAEQQQQQHQLPRLASATSTRQASAAGHRSASRSTRLKPIGAAGGSIVDGDKSGEETMRVVDV